MKGSDNQLVSSDCPRVNFFLGGVILIFYTKMLGTNFCGAISLEFPGVGNVQGIYSREYSGGDFSRGM